MQVIITIKEEEKKPKTGKTITTKEERIEIGTKQKQEYTSFGGVCLSVCKKQ